MTTVSGIVKDLIDEIPSIEEFMIQGLISNAALAEKLMPKIESRLGKKVKRSTIVMALRRYGDNIQKISNKQAKSLFLSDITMRSGVVDLVVRKSVGLMEKIDKIYSLVDFSSGEVIHLIQGNVEIGLILSEKRLKEALEVLEGEEILIQKESLVAITLFLDKTHYVTPGVIFLPVRKLSFNNVNIFEIVSTSTELIFIVSNKDAARGYNCLMELVEKPKTK